MNLFFFRPSYSLIDRTLDSLFRDSAISNTTEDEVTIADAISEFPGEIRGDNDTDDISKEVSDDKENRLDVNSSEINQVDAENESTSVVIIEQSDDIIEEDTASSTTTENAAFEVSIYTYKLDIARHLILIGIFLKN